ncbi:hypothetical protein EY178_14915, partial [Shigella sonnei]|nr:hypothetical protein [Shigella sonnei]HAY6156287.1 hypothetical protein [Shigella sonnei]
KTITYLSDTGCLEIQGASLADYKTRWPAMADVSESVVVGQKIDNISLDEFAKALKSVLARI